MLRSILAVIGGYVVMALFVMVALTLLYLVLGADGSFKPNSYEVSLSWALATTAVGFVAGALGGYACVAIAQRFRAALYLAVLVVVLGAISGVMAMSSEKVDLGPRSSELSSFEAATKAQQPLWAVLLNPVIGVVGVLAGARLRKTK